MRKLPYLYTLLLLLCSTFSFQFLSRQIPGLGTLCVADLLVVYISYMWLNHLAKGSRLDNIDKCVLLISAWILFASLTNVMIGEMQLQLFLKLPVRISLLWPSVILLRRIQLQDLKKILIYSSIIALGASLFHAYLTLTDQRDLMPYLYYAISDDPAAPEQAWSSRLYVPTPGGQLFFGSCAAAVFFCNLHTVSIRVRIYLLGAMVILYICSLLNITRSVSIGLLLFTPLWSLLLTYGVRGRLARMIVVCLVLSLGLGITLAYYPALWTRYVARFSLFPEVINVYDPDRPRVMDAVQACKEIRERPFIGNGYPTLRDYTTPTGGDVNPYLKLGLLGGIPLIVLFVVFLVLAFTQAHKKKNDFVTRLGVVTVGYMLFMWLLIGPGGNGPISLREIVPFLLAIACLTNIHPSNRYFLLRYGELGIRKKVSRMRGMSNVR